MAFLDILAAILVAFRLMGLTDLPMWQCFLPVVVSIIMTVITSILEIHNREREENESQN